MNRIGEALCAALREDTTTPLTLTPDDWRAVATLAIRQRVGPLLFSRKHLPFPDDVRAQLRARAEVSAKRVLMQQAAFRELAARVAPHGISLIALKGLHLATSVYPSPVLREMNDIDVMVRPEQVETVSDVVRALGYRPLGEIPVAIALKAMHHVPRFIKGQIGLEVHWRLAPAGTPPTVEPEALWSGARPLGLAPNAMTLAPEDLLVHICVHAAGLHHFEQGIRPLCDVLTMLSVWRDRLDWDGVVERARAWQCDRSVAIVLTLAQSRLGAPLPAEVLANMADARPSAAIVDLAFTQALSAGRFACHKASTSRVTHPAACRTDGDYLSERRNESNHAQIGCAETRCRSGSPTRMEPSDSRRSTAQSGTHSPRSTQRAGRVDPRALDQDPNCHQRKSAGQAGQ